MMKAVNTVTDLKLIGYHCPPEEYFDYLSEIEKDSEGSIKWAMWKAYILGTMHGKRAERARRAQR